MISQKYRFHGHASLKYVFNKGRAARGQWFSVKFVENSRRHEPRIAVIVSKKIAKRAVVRNRIRRRIYEIVRPHLAHARAVDVAISVYSAEVATASHDEITTQLLPLLHQTHLKPRQNL
jgi:ribonuclease P protein component